ncbi:MAG: hypothetical protein B7X06_04290, partial [Verrucomicrobia bacterium 21-51-4]
MLNHGAISRRLLVGITIFGALSGCRGTPHAPDLSAAPSFERGFQLFPSPRTFDPPGTIFRVDESGIRHPVADLSGLLHVTAKPEALPRIVVAGVFDANGFFSWASNAAFTLRAVRIDSAVVAVFGAKREQAYEVDLRRLIDSASKLIDWTRPGRLYLISETVEADSVDIDLSSMLADSLSAHLTATGAHPPGIGLAWDPHSSTRLAIHFPSPYRVMYRAEQLLRPRELEDSTGRGLRI